MGGCIGWLALFVASFAFPDLAHPTGLYVTLAIVAVISIPILLPYGRRLSVFMRWLLGSATLVYLVVGLGALAVCSGFYH